MTLDRDILNKARNEWHTKHQKFLENMGLVLTSGTTIKDGNMAIYGWIQNKSGKNYTSETIDFLEKELGQEYSFEGYSIPIDLDFQDNSKDF